MTIDVRKLHKKWMKDSEYREAYAEIAPEFELAKKMIRARKRAQLTQAEVAARMGTTQSEVARIESGKRPPKIETLERFALATGNRLRLSFAPMPEPRPVRSKLE